ncbi:ABC transporter ATP-binding protein [Corynebacterium camporealensis]
MTQPVAISARRLTKSYSRGNVQALREVSFDIDRGEVVAILGHNGAGKTTLIDILLGLVTPTSGEVALSGHSPTDAVRAGAVGAILQSGGLLPDITVMEALRMVAATHRQARPLAEVITEARLDPLLGRRISRCSGGEQQRVKFALALLADPVLIVFDEPTTGMDPGARRDFWQDIRRRAHGDTTVVFSTHILHEAETFASRVIMMDKGRIFADGSVAELLSSRRGKRVDFHGGARAADIVAALEARPEVSSVIRNSKNTLEVSAMSQDADTTAQFLLNDTSARNLRIQDSTLEDVFFSVSGGVDPEEDE